MTRYGIIDLGSNTVRLVVYDVKASLDELRARTPSEKFFKIIIDKKKMAGLAAYVVKDELTQEGINLTVRTLQNLLGLAANVHCDKVHIFATAFLRNCKNNEEASRTIERRINKKVNILSAKEEAHLGFVGASLTQPLVEGALIDIGGGSTELTALRPDGDHHNISLPAGCVSLYAQEVKCVIPSTEECAAMGHAFSNLLEENGGIKPYATKHAYAIGGSVRAIAKLYATVHELSPRPRRITIEQIDSLFDLLDHDQGAFAHYVVKAVPERVHSLVPGMVIARTLLEKMGARDITLCKYGVREGYLATALTKQ
jgi:exopolyphosphatase/guanosine-5'-triphosphate,3'-diphosphate pyrophosphatase